MRVPIPYDDEGNIDRLAWLRVRQELQRTYYSASSAGALLGVHPFVSLGDVAVTHLRPELITEDKQSAAAERGHYLEPALLNWLADKVGVAIAPPRFMYADNSFACTPDGEFVGSTDTQPEAKTYRYFLDDGEVLPYWRAQAVAICAARPGLETVLFVVLDGALRLHQIEVRPFPGEVDELVSRAERFLAFVGMGVVPDEADLSEQNVKALWPDPVPAKAVEADEDTAEAAVTWMQMRRARLDAKDEEDRLRNRLAGYLRDAEVLTIGGEPTVLYPKNGQGRVLRPAKDMG